MNRLSQRLLARFGLACLSGIAVVGTVGGCNSEEKKPPPKPVVRYPDLGPKKEVPDFMAGTVWERVELGNTEPYDVSGWGLVVNLDGTGDSDAPTAVKQYMIKEMVKRGFGSRLIPGFENMPPEAVLRDPRVAIVQVEGLLPPGVRKGQSFDVYVSAIRNNNTTSLAHGILYRTDLKREGADPVNPFGKINVFGVAKGFVFVNPAYALYGGAQVPAGPARASLRRGMILDGGVASFDRPLFLQLRQPQRSVSRVIEQRIIRRYQDTAIAAAEDEGIVSLYVPTGMYGADWEHFSGVVTHLYLKDSPEFQAAKARQLVEAALKPNAALQDISYCWEGIGKQSLPFIAPLMTNHSPDVEFAAARAAAFIGDPSGAAQVALSMMAHSADHPFQLSAVQVLGALPSSSSVNQMLRELLDSEKSLVRVEAYKVLARNHDPSVFSRVITEDPDNQKFILDIVPSHGPPLIYATRSGTPRLAIIGTLPEVTFPVTFSALDERLTISSGAVGGNITIYYRDPRSKSPVQTLSRPDVPELIARLGGSAAPGDRPLDFSYAEILAILQQLSDQHRLAGSLDGQQVAASFMLQQPPRTEERIFAAPSIGGGRPQVEEKPPAAEAPASDSAVLAGRAQ